MAIGDDFSIDAEKNIRYTGTTANYTVLQFHRWLGDLADDAIFVGDDVLDITDQTPSERATDNIITLLNGYNIDDTAAQHIYNGSITQDGGDTVYSGLVVVGSVETGTQLQIIQDNTILTDFYSSFPNDDPGNNILLRIMVKTRVNGADIDDKRIRVQARELGDTYAEFLVSLGAGNSTAAIFTSVDLNNATAAGTIAGWTISNTEGLNLIDVDGNGTPEEYYSQWDKGVQSINDLYEYTKWLQRRGSAQTVYGLDGELFRGITDSWAYDGEVGGPFTQNEVLVWGTSLDYENELNGPFVQGEYVSFSGGATGKLLYLLDAGTTGSMVIQKESGSPAIVDTETITGLTSGATADITAASIVGDSLNGGSGQLLAFDDDGLTGEIYIQRLSGSSPADNQEVLGRTSLATSLVNGATNQRTVSPSFIGASTGSAIIGAYGVGIQAADLTNADQLFDLTNTLRVPPNNVTFTVQGLVSGEDRVLVGPEDGSGGLDTDQLLGATGSNAAGAATYETVGAIPSDTPQTGTIRVFNGDSYDRVPYTSYTGTTFTLTTTLPNAGVSHIIQYDGEVGGPFSEGETLTFGAGGTAELVRLIDDGLTGTMFIRMISGAVPIDNESITGGTSTATAAVNGAADPEGGFISYIDKLAAATSESFTSVYNADRTLFVRVRDGGATPIRTFQTTGTLGSGGGSSTAIRTSDV